MWFYRRIQFCVEYEGGIGVVYVSPAVTSSKCPKCSSRLVEYGYRTQRCINCNYIGDRDVIATINLYRKLVSMYSRCELL